MIVSKVFPLGVRQVIFFILQFPSCSCIHILIESIPIAFDKLADRLKQIVSAVSSILPHNVETTEMSDQSGIDAEEKGFQDEIKQIKEWWKDSRWRNVRRPYTAETIANKRGTIKAEYPSNFTAKKLWNIMEKRFEVMLCSPDMKRAL